MNALLVVGLLAVIGPPQAGHWAKDTSGKISSATLQALDRIAADVNRSGNGQLGVLVVKTTSGVPPRTFATGVFNHWGVGHSEYKNGILLFVALDDRKAEIILGDGLTHVTSADTDVVMREQVVANFKAGRPEQALLDGANALSALLTARVAGVPEQQAAVSTQDALSEGKVTELFRSGELADPSPRRWVIDLTGEVKPDTVHALERLPNALYASDARQLFLVFFRSRVFSASQVRDRALASLSVKHPRAALLAVNLEHPDTAFSLPPELRADSRAAALEADVESLSRYPAEPGNVIAANERAASILTDGFPLRSPREVVGEVVERFGTAFMAAGGLFLLGGAFWGRRWNRYRSRSCEACHRPRQMLPAGAEDKHLTGGQQTEQAVGAIDYDVWWCGVCRTVLVRDNSAWFSGFARCDSCSNKTLRSTSTTLQHATEYSGGLVQVDEKCAHCSHARSYTRNTARLTRSSNTSSFSSSSSGSSGSSFGGGSSSGGGSSGSW